MTFQPLEVRRASVSDDVVEQLKARIAGGELRAGDRLPSQRALSEALGVSLPTAREAIRSLTNMGVLEVRHGSGTYVTSLSTDQLMDSMRFALSLGSRTLAELFDVRLMLEPAIARAAAERRTEAQARQLAECVERSRRPDVTIEELLELDLQVHRLVVEAANNALLSRLMDSIAALGTESRSRTLELPGVEPETVDDHARIVEAIRRRRGTASERAMRGHIERIRDIAVRAGLLASRATA